MTEKELARKTQANIQEKASLIWATADKLVGLYSPHEYGKVIVPMTVIKRFNDALVSTKDDVLKKNKELIEKKIEVRDGILQTVAGYDFYNISNFTFDTLISDSEHIEANFRAFLAGFSDNVQDILVNFEFDKEITKLSNEGRLFVIIQEFNTKKAYMGPDQVSSVDMGYIFEELVRRFSESYNEQAGAHFTSRDIIYLMTDLLLCEDKEILADDGIAKTVYDMAMGTSQMLACMTERLKSLDEDADIKCFGQEINPQTFAIAKADMLIKGGDSDSMKKGDTLGDDKFSNYTFDYVISNPPFGIEWKVDKTAVEKEYARGENGRFAPGLPSISDSQMLFMLNGLKKLKDSGRMAIIQNGSPLFSGDAGSGPSEIRKYIIESDYLEAIVQLSNDSFYNTGISTYIWIISKEKSKDRVGKVQLIDASGMSEKMRKSIGSKRNEITEECRANIVKLFADFYTEEYFFGGRYIESKIFNNQDFGYTKITVETPLLDENDKVVMKNKKPVADPSKRDTENVPLTEDIKEYFNREVLPYNPTAFIDESKSKVGYEIPFTRHFYKYVAPRKTEKIMEEILNIEAKLDGALKELFANE